GAFYANLAPGGARFAPDTVVVAPTSAYEYNNIEQAASISWDDGARFGSDFMPSRSYLEWTFMSVAPTRARLVVKEQGGIVRVQNALGAEVDYAVVKLPEGVYTVSSVRDGEDKPATPMKSEAALPVLGALEPR